MSATIQNSAPLRALKVKPSGRPLPHHLRAEAHVESLCALSHDAELFQRGSRMLRLIEAYRRKHQCELRAGTICIDVFGSREDCLDRAQSKLEREMCLRGNRLNKAVIPELRRLHIASNA
jgi:hypothetical protein